MDILSGHMESVVSLAERAGRAVLDVYARGSAASSVQWKEDDSPLTEADRVSHDLLLAGLKELTPDIPVVSEEGAPEDRTPPEAEGSRWVVDPLDGTKEFLKRTGEFTVNVALVRENRLVAGVVHAPAVEGGRTWIGTGDGAQLREAGGSRRRLTVRRANPDALGVVASRDHAGPVVRNLLASLPGSKTLSMGSSLKFCLLAEGRADLYFRDGPTMEWDTAAAQAVLEAAGGGVYTLDGRPLRYGKPELRNPHFVAVGDRKLDWRTLLAEIQGEA